MNTIFSLGIVLLGGLAAEKIVNRYNIPAITAYILLGILIGPHTLHLTGDELMAASGLLSNTVLGFIAFHIGRNFSLSNLKEIGRGVIYMSLMAAIFPWLCVTLGLYYLAGQPLHIALIFGSISAATAPTATMMVVRQYKAKGSFTDLLLGIVAIDDAWGIIAFSLSIAVAQHIQVGHLYEAAILPASFKAVGKIFLSMLLGSIAAVVISKSSVKIKRRGDTLTYILGAVLLNTGIALSLHLSPLLSNMAFGAILVNIDKTAFRFFDLIKDIDWPLYIIFYVLAGANLDVGILSTLGLIGLLYLFLRITGKIAGAYLGGFIAKSDSSVRNYMGLALMPQAGVALGLAMVSRTYFPVVGGTIFTTIAATTVIYEIFGPLATRYALLKAGDIS